MIYKKLFEFRKLGIKIVKDGANPHFKSSYPTLNEVLDKVTPPLNKLDILVLQLPEEKGLRTRLYDVSDDTFVDGFLPYVEATTAQKIGSNNTYNRRYSLVTMLGLEDIDEDGEIASAPKPVARPVTTQVPKYTGTIKVIEKELGKLEKAPVTQDDNDLPF